MALRKYTSPLIILVSISLISLNYWISSTTKDTVQRQASTYLGNGRCRWTPPQYHISIRNKRFHKTLIAGFPSGDKRLTFAQLEALTGFAAKDEWDFEFLGITNEPFIKANYPHHEGIWGWGQEADQVVLVVRNIRRTMVEYHDILWDIGFPQTWQPAFDRVGSLFRAHSPLEDFVAWRDLRVMEEIHWYGWFIDYWMEGGLMRDMFNSRITTPEHWYMLMRPNAHTREEMSYERIVGNATVTPSYDPHCLSDVSGGCHPLEIISAERLVRPDTGPAENRKIAQILVNKTGFNESLIPEDAWECIWTELIVNKKGFRTFIDRGDLADRDYNFSEEMLEKMIRELDRLITKYDSPEWHHIYTARTLVGILSEHRALLLVEYSQVHAGERRLKYDDFLGPVTRGKRKQEMERNQLYW